MPAVERRVRERPLVHHLPGFVRLRYERLPRDQFHFAEARALVLEPRLFAVLRELHADETGRRQRFGRLGLNRHAGHHRRQPGQLRLIAGKGSVGHQAVDHDLAAGREAAERFRDECVPLSLG